MSLTWHLFFFNNEFHVPKILRWKQDPSSILDRDLAWFCRWISSKSGHSWREVGSVLCFNRFESQIVLCFEKPAWFSLCFLSICKFPKKKTPSQTWEALEMAVSSKYLTPQICAWKTRPMTTSVVSTDMFVQVPYLLHSSTAWLVLRGYHVGELNGRINRLLGTKRRKAQVQCMPVHTHIYIYIYIYIYTHHIHNAGIRRHIIYTVFPFFPISS